MQWIILAFTAILFLIIGFWLGMYAASEIEKYKDRDDPYRL